MEGASWRGQPLDIFTFIHRVKREFDEIPCKLVSPEFARSLRIPPERVGYCHQCCCRVGELAAACRERVDVSAAGRRSSVSGAASCQVMSSGLSSVVSSTPVEDAPGATNLHRLALVPSPLHFHTLAH